MLPKPGHSLAQAPLPDPWAGLNIIARGRPRPAKPHVSSLSTSIQPSDKRHCFLTASSSFHHLHRAQNFYNPDKLIDFSHTYHSFPNPPKKQLIINLKSSHKYHIYTYIYLLNHSIQGNSPSKGPAHLVAPISLRSDHSRVRIYMSQLDIDKSHL